MPSSCTTFPMSKRLCISLLHAPSHSPQPLLQRCSTFHSRSTTGRNNPKSNSNPHSLRHHVRAFTTTPSIRVGVGRMVSRHQPSQPSMAVMRKSQQKQAEETGALLDHIGIMDGTFIPPTGANLPSLLKEPRGRLKLEYRRLRQAVLDWGRNRFQVIFFIKPRPRLGRSEAKRTASRLYEGMYAHFARGNLAPVESTLAPGLLSSLRSRIAERAANSSLLWTLHGYIASPRVVSHKLGMLPGKKKNTEQTGLEQVVVRIRSAQSLVRMQKMKVSKGAKTVVESVPVDNEGKRIPADVLERYKTAAIKDTTEYVVVQRFMNKSRFGPWHLWGTAEETTLDKLKRDEQKHIDAVLRTAGQS